MKNIKRFEIDVETSFPSGDEEYTDFYPLQIIDLKTDYPSAMDGTSIAEIKIYGQDESEASFRLGLEDIQALFEVLAHIRNKVLDQKKDKPEN